MYRAIIAEDDVTAFKISCHHKGRLIGTWDQRQAQADTTFHLRFDPACMTFLTGGSFPSTASQGWNADGTSSHCGNPGFGFNSGNFGQDICLKGEWLEASSIEPDTAFLATLDPVTPDCRNTAAVSKQ